MNERGAVLSNAQPSLLPSKGRHRLEAATQSQASRDHSMAGVRAPERETPKFIAASSVEGAAVAPRDRNAFPDERARRQAAPDRDHQHREQRVARGHGGALDEAEVHRGQNVHRQVRSEHRYVEDPSGQAEEEGPIDEPRDLLIKEIPPKFEVARYRDNDDKIDVEDDPEHRDGTPRREHHAQGQPTRREVRKKSG